MISSEDNLLSCHDQYMFPGSITKRMHDTAETTAELDNT